MSINLLVILFTITLGFLLLQKERVVLITDEKGISQWTKVTNRKRFIIFITVILILQSGLRNWAVGADTYAYFLRFEQVKEMSWLQVIEAFKQYYQFGEGKDPGYTLFQKFVQLFIKNYQLYLILIAVIFFSAFGNFVYKNTKLLTDAMLAYVIYSILFYSFFSITGHRQTIATAAALFSFELVKKRKIFKFLFLILLVSTIHKSIFIFLPVYFLPKIKNVKFFYVAVLVLFPLIFSFRVPISLYFQSISGYDYGIYEQAGTPVFTLLMVLIAVFAFIRYKQVMKLIPEAKLIYLAIAIALFFTPLTWVNPSAMRVVQYFSIFLVLLIPEVVHSFSLISSKMKTFLYLSVLLLLISVYLVSGGSEYKFFWQDMQLPIQYFY
ncbi:MAG: EpsG family protein [Clostridiaceae bacterium]|nr:EpsG family protein [Clostridiaceae bacterium]